MKKLSRIISLFVFALICSYCQSCIGQVSEKPKSPLTANRNNTLVGGRCEDCDIIYADMPNKMLNADTSKGWNEPGQKMIVSGVIFKPDGKTPAEGIILYYWQTDNTGKYTAREGMSEKAKRHGHLRGWVKTDKTGTYRIYTIRPKPYPGDQIPAHIHFLVKEPDISNEYYIDDLNFDDDPFLTDIERNRKGRRGGNGLVKVEKKDNIQLARFNITLGLNIPDYPTN